MRRVASATAALQSLDRSSAGHSALRDESPEPGRQSSNSVHGGNAFSRSPRRHTARRELPTHEVVPILELSSCAACGGFKSTTSLVQLPPPDAGPKEKAAHWRTLPPLPAPTSNREQQAVKGLVTVIGLASFAVLLAETAANFVAPGASTRAPASIVDACAIVVVSCYLGVRRATSHLLARTEKTATPIPPEVSAALRGGADAPAMPTRNIVGADGRKYCVRCLLWRPAGVRSHHCRVCNRCSVGFDHHCHILGRCIAGNCGRKGNLLAFRGLLASTGIGLFATMITLAVSAMTLFQSLVRDKGDDDGAANATCSRSSTRPSRCAPRSAAAASPLSSPSSASAAGSCSGSARARSSLAPRRARRSRPRRSRPRTSRGAAGWPEGGAARRTILHVHCVRVAGSEVTQLKRFLAVRL